MSLFDKSGFMRSNNKSELGNLLISSGDSILLDPKDTPDNSLIVIDGGALLHRVGWTKGESFTNIFKGYINFIHNLFSARYGNDICIVFDGYLIPSTKDHMHSKRQTISSLPIKITRDDILLCKKEVYLSNKENKQLFINMLSADITDNGHNVILCDDDADVKLSRWL